MLQWAVVAFVVLACAALEVWTLMRAAWQRLWRARTGPALRQVDMLNQGTGDCDRCSACASVPAAKASPQPKIVLVLPRG